MADEQILGLQSESTVYSYRRYVGQYEEFRAGEEHSEDLLLRFLVKQSENMAPTSLWTIFSHVKKYLLLECKLNIGCTQRITGYLKTLARFHKKKKAPSFSREDLFEYLRRAESQGRHLINKLVLLIGFYGGMRCCEIVSLMWEDVVFASEGILIMIRFSKTDRAGVGATKLLPKLEEKAVCPHFYFTVYRDAVADRNGRLFRHYTNGKFTKAPIGKNVISSIPATIARFLGFENPSTYTGHSLRVTSATILADEGASCITLKRHGRWSSDSVAEGYLRDSKQARNETASLLSGSASANLPTSSGKQTSVPTIIFQNCVFNGNVVMHSKEDVN